MKKVIMRACIGLLMLSGVVYAESPERSDEIETLRRTVEQQNRTISDLLQRLEALEVDQDAMEVRQEDQGDWIEAEKEKVLWTDKVKIGGDFRYRHEYIDDDRKTDDRHRNRIRARINAEAEIYDWLDYRMEISTGEEVDADGNAEGDPASNNQTLDNSWSLKNVWVSQAFVDIHPRQLEGFHLLAGKIKRPFHSVGKNELIFDGDVNPEGAVIKYERGLNDALEMFANGYGFWVIERSSDADTSLWGAQGGLKYNFAAFGDKAHLAGGASYFDYGNIEGQTPFIDGKRFGNTLEAGLFANDFDIWSLFGEFGFRVKGYPVLVFGEYAENNDASDEESGWVVGAGIGKAKEKGSWAFRYQYKDVEADAVFGTFTDSDFGGGGTDAEGHELNFTYALAKNVTVAASYFVNDVDVSGDEEDYERLQLDFILKF